MMVRPSGANRAKVTEPRLNVSGSKVAVVVLVVERPATNSAAPAAIASAARAACRSHRRPWGLGVSITAWLDRLDSDSMSNATSRAD